METLIVVFILTAALKYAWDHSRADFRKSKTAHRQKQPAKQKRAAELVHHDIGYWTHQGTHGFPAFRHGFGQGWHEARQKAVRDREARERAKAEHLETAADLEPQITGHRQRQAEARDRIREARQPGEGSGEGSPDVPPDDAPQQEPAEQDQQPQERRQPQETPTQGDPMPAAADTTYDGVLQDMAAAKNVAEGNAAEAQSASKNADSLADQMQALNVDPATLSAMADHQAAHDDVMKAYQRLVETAENVEATLKRGHQGLAEAHQNAPVEAAERPFYAA